MVDITGAAAADKKRRQEQGRYNARMRKLANPEITIRNKKRIGGSDKAKVSYEAMKQNRKLSAFFNEEEDEDND